MNRPGGPPVALIAAVAENGALGREGGLPWRLPADLQRFKRLTLGHHLILGRRTWETLDAPLPGRIPVVVTRREGVPAGVLQAGSVGEALAIAVAAGDSEPFVGGGAEIFRLALEEDRIDRLYLTRIHHAFEGDTWFPAYDESRFRLVARADHTVAEGHPYPFSFLDFERRR
ncbi:MAG: dihydrofolate reductase [Acidobacteriota bacterium]|nr:dihydrofolate reductase [Acidobacteriota bacterium]